MFSCVTICMAGLARLRIFDVGSDLENRHILSIFQSLEYAIRPESDGWLILRRLWEPYPGREFASNLHHLLRELFAYMGARVQQFMVGCSLQREWVTQGKGINSKDGIANSYKVK
jgi:hypothetical protein